MDSKKKEARVAERALLTDWELASLTSEDAEPQHRYQAKRQLEYSVEHLPEQVKVLMENKKLYFFHQKHMDYWLELGKILREGTYRLTRPVKTDLMQVNVVRKNNRDWLWAQTFHLDTGFKKGKVNLLSGGDLDPKALKRLESLLGDLDQLQDWFAIRNIASRHTRNVVRKALRLGYHFPHSEDKAVPVSVVSSWVNDKEK